MSENYFGRQAEQYKAARPKYPPELFAHLGNLVYDHNIALDIGCGSGQATTPLSAYFNKVVGMDESAKQLEQVVQHSNNKTEFIRASASNIPLKDNSIDLITVAVAMHWFDLEKFHKEAARVLKENGTIAAWSYYIAKVNPEIDAITKNLHENKLARYIDQRCQWVIDGYKSIPFSFEYKSSAIFKYSEESDLNRFIALQRSSSLVQKEIERTGKDPVSEIEKDLQKAWGHQEKRMISWDMSLISGQAPTPRIM